MRTFKCINAIAFSVESLDITCNNLALLSNDIIIISDCITDFHSSYTSPSLSRIFLRCPSCVPIINEDPYSIRQAALISSLKSTHHTIQYTTQNVIYFTIVQILHSNIKSSHYYITTIPLIKYNLLWLIVLGRILQLLKCNTIQFIIDEAYSILILKQLFSKYPGI